MVPSEAVFGIPSNSRCSTPGATYHQWPSGTDSRPLVRVGWRKRPARATASGQSRSTVTSPPDASPVMMPTFCPLVKCLGMSAAVSRNRCQPESCGPFLPRGIGTGAHPRSTYRAAALALVAVELSVTSCYPPHRCSRGPWLGGAGPFFYCGTSCCICFLDRGRPRSALLDAKPYVPDHADQLAVKAGRFTDFFPIGVRHPSASALLGGSACFWGHFCGKAMHQRRLCVGGFIEELAHIVQVSAALAGVLLALLARAPCRQQLRHPSPAALPQSPGVGHSGPPLREPLLLEQMIKGLLLG